MCSSDLALGGAPIDHAAHFGGLIAGALAAVILSPWRSAARAWQGAAAMLVALAIAFAILPGPAAQDVASREAEIRFRADLRSFGTREKELLERAKALISAWPQEKAVNEARVLANQWDALHERFAAYQLSASSDSARLHELLLRYTDLRRRAYRALVDLPREAAPAEFERLAHEIKQTVDEINSLSSRRG